MPSVNPGPSVTQTQQTVDVLTPVNTMSNPAVQGSNALRLLGVAKGVSLTGTGDVAVLSIINAATWVVHSILVGNAVGGSAAAGNITVNAGPGVTGQNFRAAGVLAGVTGPTTVVAQTVLAASLAVINTAQKVYVNNTVAVAGVTVDIFFYGYDLSASS
jgi:hypothetical protein